MNDANKGREMTSSNSTGKKNRSSLKERLQKPGGISADEAIKRGQDAVNELRGDYKAELVQDIAKLTRLSKKKPKVYAPKDAWWDEIRKKLGDMRNVAGTYDYLLVTLLCDSLLDYLDSVEDDTQFDNVFERHISALQHVASNDIQGKGGPDEAEMVKKLRALVNQRKKNAEFKRDHNDKGRFESGSSAS